MHEVHVDVLPRSGREPRRPPCEIVVRIFLQPQSHIAPGCGFDQRRRRVVFALGQAQRGARFLQRGVHLVIEPTVVAELERGPMIVGQHLQEFGQPRQVLLQEWRQLEQHRPALGAERIEGAIQIGNRIGCCLRLEARIVGNAARGLDREPEVFRRLRGPVLQHRHLGHPVEGIVDLDGGQALGIVGQHGIGLDGLGIEGPLPFLVGIATRTCQHLCCHWPALQAAITPARPAPPWSSGRCPATRS